MMKEAVYVYGMRTGSETQGKRSRKVVLNFLCFVLMNFQNPF